MYPRSFFLLLNPPPLLISRFKQGKPYQQLTHEFYRRVCLCVNQLMHYYMMKSPCHTEMCIYRLILINILFISLENVLCLLLLLMLAKKIISALLPHCIADGPAASGELGGGGEQRKPKSRLPNTTSSNQTPSILKCFRQ